MYLAEHPALALVEAIVNLRGNPALFPDNYQLIKAEAEDGASSELLDEASLSAEWRRNPNETRGLGDEWLRAGRSALLVVPSAPVPEALIYLLNPLHRDAALVRRLWSKRVRYDQRLFPAV